jgi:hypothetical protein
MTEIMETPAPPDDGIKDFTKKRKKLRFKIDNDIFEAAPAVPADTLITFSKRFAGSDPEKMTVEQQLSLFEEMLSVTLLPESLPRFKDRMADPANPVDIDQVGEVVDWLFESYGMVPTKQPTESSDGLPSQESGTTLTDNTQQTVSISAASPFTGS